MIHYDNPFISGVHGPGHESIQHRTRKSNQTDKTCINLNQFLIVTFLMLFLQMLNPQTSALKRIPICIHIF